jgi:hypothetical protein
MTIRLYLSDFTIFRHLLSDFLIFQHCLSGFQTMFPVFRLANQANTTVKTDMKHATLVTTSRFSSLGAERHGVVLGLGRLNTHPTESGFE